MHRPRHLDAHTLALLLERLPGARGAFEVCGYLAALVTAPNHVPQDEWLPDVLGEGYTAHDGAEEAVEEVFAFYQGIYERLVRGESVGPPVDVDAIGAWAQGYCDAAEADVIWSNDRPGARLLVLIDDIGASLESERDVSEAIREAEEALARDAEAEDDASAGDDGGAGAQVIHLAPPHVALVTDDIVDDEDDEDDEGEPISAADFELTQEQIEDMAEELDDLARLAFVYWREARGKRTVDATPLLPNPRPVRAAAKVSRNAPCPCGSGKKYKVCCGADA